MKFSAFLVYYITNERVDSDTFSFVSLLRTAANQRSLKFVD